MILLKNRHIHCMTVPPCPQNNENYSQYPIISQYNIPLGVYIST